MKFNQKQSDGGQSIINPNEFEGLGSFQEINPRLARAVTKNGKSFLHIKNAKVRKVKSKLTKSSKRNNPKSSSAVPEISSVEIKDDTAWTSIFTPSPVIAALRNLGFSYPSEIQGKTIPAAIKGKKDIIGAAETGSGKTLAFGIPIIDGILRIKERERLNLEEGNTVEAEEDDDMNNDTEEPLESEGLISNDDYASDMEMNLNDEEMSIDESGGIGCVKVIDNANFDFMPPVVQPSSPHGKLYSLIVTPTRELAVQIKKHLDAILTFTSLKTAVVIGGLSEAKQDRVLNKHPEIVIGTPGRLWEMFTQRNRHLAQMPQIRFLVIDETDRMLEAGHFQELKSILGIINGDEKAKKKRQTFVFSATLTFTFDPPKRLLSANKEVSKITREMKIENIINLIGMKAKPKIVDITRKFGTAETLTEVKIFCEQDDKDDYLYYFLKKYPGRTLVFCNSINCVRRLTNLLTILQCAPKALHASKQQRQRLKNLEHFASGEDCVLIATDVAARGIDIPSVNHIIHYELPRTVDTYIHRSGRTARANQEGLSVMLIDSSDVVKYKQFCVSLNRTSGFASMPIQEESLLQIRKRVSLGRQLEHLEFQTKTLKLKDKWLQTMAREAGIMLDSDESDQDDHSMDEIAKRKQSENVRVKRMELKRLLSRPLMSTAYVGKFPSIPAILGAALDKGTALDLVKNRGNNKETHKPITIKKLSRVSAKSKISDLTKKKWRKKKKNDKTST